MMLTEPLGYVEFSALRLPGARGADRLRWRPEGGVPCRGALRDAASEHRVGGDRREPAGTRSSTSTPARRSRRWNATRSGETHRSSTATATRPSAAWRRSGRMSAGCEPHERATGQPDPRRRRRPRLLGAEPGAQLRRDRRLRADLAVRRLRAGPREAGAVAFPSARTTGELDELLDDPELDAVVLATPVPTHAELAIAVAEAGKHCFVEKPLATTAADAERAVDAAERAGRILMVGPPARVPPGGRAPEGADRRGRAGLALLPVRQPPEPRQAARGRERAVEPRRARRLGRAAPDRRGARRSASRTAQSYVRDGRAGRRLLLPALPLGHRRPPASLLARPPQGAAHHGRRAHAGWRPSTTC